MERKHCWITLAVVRISTHNACFTTKPIEYTCNNIHLHGQTWHAFWQQLRKLFGTVIPSASHTEHTGALRSFIHDTYINHTNSTQNMVNTAVHRSDCLAWDSCRKKSHYTRYSTHTDSAFHTDVPQLRLARGPSRNTLVLCRCTQGIVEFFRYSKTK